MMLVQEESAYIWPAINHVVIAGNQNDTRVKQGVLDAF